MERPCRELSKLGDKPWTSKTCWKKSTRAGVQAPRAGVCFLGMGLDALMSAGRSTWTGVAAHGLGNQHEDKLLVFPQSSKES